MEFLIDAKEMIFHLVLSENQVFYFLSPGERAIKETRILVWLVVAAAGSGIWGEMQEKLYSDIYYALNLLWQLFYICKSYGF